MAWYPNARKLEVQPESDAQPAIRPTQVIFHSLAAPWTGQRTYEFWRDSTNLESHFFVGFDGDVAQFIGTQTRADANMHANRRSDGSGAVSVETASNTQHTDPWTDEQINALIGIGVWVWRTHGVPLRIARSWDDPGFGTHRMFSQWSDGGTACPGDARHRQFLDRVFPGIVAAANGGNSGGSSGGGLASFPGADYFHNNPRSSLITAMGKRLVEEGCSAYSSGPGPQWTDADRQSYAKWQRKLGYSGADADGWPGPSSWAKLRVPNN
ncbi:peptidoglycan-binding protein [Kitasatospora purpeofusca]|uniref:peptidoglycan-binding protein n=1 Tax=Kitasatospora purpeofusca TaxID=67352 RepID=UPI003809100A